VQWRSQNIGNTMSIIGNWQRFSNRRRVGSYTGEDSSGNTRIQRCVTKHGNPRLRAALVEAAWRLVRFQPNYRAVKNGDTCWPKKRWPRELPARKPS